MIKSRIFITAALFVAALICARLSGRPVSNQPAEDNCLDVYNVCYNNCKGKSDQCYSNCDVAYRHCMHGAGVDFPLIKKHPFRPADAAVNANKGIATSAATATPTPSRAGRAAASKKSKPTPAPTPTPTPGSKKHKG